MKDTKNKFTKGQTVKAWDQKGQGYFIGKIEGLETKRGIRFASVRPERKSGKKGNFMLDFIVRERILSLVPVSFLSAIKENA